MKESWQSSGPFTSAESNFAVMVNYASTVSTAGAEGNDPFLGATLGMLPKNSAVS